MSVLPQPSRRHVHTTLVASWEWHWCLLQNYDFYFQYLYMKFYLNLTMLCALAKNPSTGNATDVNMHGKDTTYSPTPLR